MRDKKIMSEKEKWTKRVVSCLLFIVVVGVRWGRI